MLSSVSKSEKSISSTTAVTVLAAAIVDFIIWILRIQLRQPVDLHEYGLDAFFCLLLAVVFFRFSRVGLALIFSVVPLILFARWIFTFFERWQHALAIDSAVGSDDKLIEGNFISFFVVRAGLIPWDILVLLSLTVFIAWLIAKLFLSRPLEK